MERTYTISFQKVKEKSPETQRAKKALVHLRAFLAKHMKAEEVVIDNSVNEKVWGRGISKIPAKLKVKAVKQEDGKVIATLAE